MFYPHSTWITGTQILEEYCIVKKNPERISLLRWELGSSWIISSGFIAAGTHKYLSQKFPQVSYLWCSVPTHLTPMIAIAVHHSNRMTLTYPIPPAFKKVPPAATFYWQNSLDTQLKAVVWKYVQQGTSAIASSQWKYATMRGCFGTTLLAFKRLLKIAHPKHIGLPELIRVEFVPFYSFTT